MGDKVYRYYPKGSGPGSLRGRFGTGPRKKTIRISKGYIRIPMAASEPVGLNEDGMALVATFHERETGESRGILLQLVPDNTPGSVMFHAYGSGKGGWISLRGLLRKRGFSPDMEGEFKFILSTEPGKKAIFIVMPEETRFTYDVETEENYREGR